MLKKIVPEKFNKLIYHFTRNFCYMEISCRVAFRICVEVQLTPRLHARSKMS